MNLREVLHVIGALLMWTAGAMLLPTVYAAGEGLFVPWMAASLGTAVLGLGLWRLTPREIRINPREGVAIVGLGWIAIVLAGAVPFIVTGTAPTVAGAVFESVSGFTTTGATIFPIIEDLPRSILLWRSISHWLGGMGIIVLGVAILPLLGMGGAQLFHAEAPGIPSDRLRPRIASTARLLWGVYALLTAMLAGLYLLLDMDVFEAVNHAMSCLATGGFSTRTASMGAFSAVTQWVTMLFMIVAGTNFTLHYRVLSGRLGAWVRDEEWRWYVGSMAVAWAMVFVALGVSRGGWGADAAREAMFNVTAVHTTTGFATADFGLWPAFAQVILLGLMFMGAMGGSTGGGFKSVRTGVVLKHVAGEIRKVLHPRAVVVTKLGGRAVRPEVLHNVLAFLALYVVTHGIGTLLLAAMGEDLVTALSASLAAMSSIGPGLGEVGPASHYGNLGSAAHLVLSLLMLLGRLEFYTLLVLVFPSTWASWGGTE
ncbi:MAG: TrkH family potassium uptake protein [Gemmatimonadota bacterium]|nr:TrkH family potassium uptake protein [Gemmatimonadota bacterium]MDH3369048.1 TrkH family potassium uptake protein [Gemmatimonadota bacterium]MDH3477297.1 TrkH family potassium uptake protein [Gemmatimonadota bacterium]MDH3569834.1 TrkH family potassium uptake protein [Gemmatimonadota bacterium]MDH5550855.1 TrkH family potassium uptake protein [Gemmatimonadota bacterium]